jgi:carboxypeptidase C (cathepsin A)
LLPNPYSWNKKANILMFDNPAGVGYSVGEVPHDLLHDDQSVEDDLFLTMQRFYYDWPNLRNNSLYLSGISYAGVYAPVLAYRIHIKN